MKVLLAMDHSRYAKNSARFLRGLELPVNSTLYLLHVIDPPLKGHASQLARFRKYKKHLVAEQTKKKAKAEEFLNRLLKPLQVGKLRVQPLFCEGSPGAEIVAIVKQYRIDLVVLGTRGLSGIRRFLLGSVSERVLNDTPCSVLVVRGHSRRTALKETRGLHVLAATDGSSDARAAVNFLPALGLPPSSECTVVHVVEPLEDEIPHPESSFGMMDGPDFGRIPDEIRRAQERFGFAVLEESERQLKRSGLKVSTTFNKGNVAENIIQIAEQLRADLLVLGSRGQTGDKRFPLGSVVHKVVRHAPCSVLVVRKNA